MAQARGTQSFARKQTVCDQGPVQAMLTFKQQTGFFESPFFAGRINTNKHLGGWQNGG